MRVSTFLVILALLFALPALAASPPDRINYQGILRNDEGVPEEGNFEMRFRFFDADTLGNEVLVDEHLFAGTGPVVVSGGLFNVALGSGDVVDGSGPGVFTSIVDVFGQLEAVWLEIEIDGETLSPRVAVLSSAYSLNSRLFQGRDVTEFIDTSGDPQEKTGLLIASGGVDFGGGADDDLDSSDVSTLTGGGNADALHSHALAGNADMLDSLDSEQFLRSDTNDTYTNGTLIIGEGTVFDVDGEIRLNAALFMDYDGPDGPQSVYFYDGGNPAGEALSWSESQDRFTLSNTLRVENGFHLEQTGDSLYINADGPDATQSIYFYDGGGPVGQSVAWDETNSEFRLSTDSRVAGILAVDETVRIGSTAILMGYDGPDQDQVIVFYNNGTPIGEALSWDDSEDRFELSDDVQVGGELEVLGPTISIGAGGPDGDQFIRFYEDGAANAESINWDDSQDRFEMTDELAIGGVIRTGTTSPNAVGYNAIGSGSATSSDITSFSDLLVSADLEVGDQMYMGGDNFMEWSTDSNFYFSEAIHIGEGVGDNVHVGGRRLYLNQGPIGSGLGQYLEHYQGTFTLSDDLDINGTLTANSKNFVQNHPYDPGLEIVYTTLEGPEASTYTRGSARLEDGFARVALDESFAWVTHPDLGLTAMLTPRGEWADLYVVELTTSELVVEATPDSAPDAAFDFLVMGLRVGYEEAPVVRPRMRDSALPEPQNLREPIAGRPDLVAHVPLNRYLETEAQVFGRDSVDLAAGDALRQAIGTSEKVASRVDVRGETQAEEEEWGSDSPRAESVMRTDDEEVAEGADGEGEVASSLTYEDAQGNLYANSFRPNSGGLGSVSPLIGDVRPGDVLSVDVDGHGVRRADLAEDVAVVGIATGPAVTDEAGNASVPFAVAGIVTCNVDASYGPIRPGDLLVTSPTPGHAMRIDGPLPGTMLGKALGTLDEGTGEVPVLVVLR